jgi:hypothetical protein
MIRLLGVRDDVIPHRGGDLIGIAKFVLSDEVIAGTGEDYDLVVAIAGEVTEGMGGVRCAPESPR